ncbi:hypothetical protein QBC46DRAFT_361678 [Diplogelasinospora grovesii]|uniref:DUF8004 domain-containing protein n=1 Tax=Diplogelasinospora grovesii TaxID=303347 RepID=A0AAN6ND94_9PEZI|nr:hypothetical protein QBC46DRAFT_361678 [Diplogelasinospora grovesii]
MPQTYQQMAAPTPTQHHTATIPTVTETGASPPTSRKTRARSVSTDRSSPRNAKLQPNSNRLQAARDASPSSEPRGRSVSVQPPKNRGSAGTDGSRVVSTPLEPRPRSNQSSDDNHSPSHGDRGRLRRSWLPGGRSRSGSADLGKPKGTGAWIISPENRADYNISVLENGEKVPELWNENGNVFVYLHPKGMGRGASFKVTDHAINPSRVLTELLMADMMSAGSGPLLTVNDAAIRETASAADGYHLYLPLGSSDTDTLVAARNLFAFLTNQPLVGMKAHPTLFAAFLQVAALLRQFGFSNYDGSSFGDSVDACFDSFLDQFAIADVRHSREKTIEGLVLAEQMKSWNLYNEAFAHAVGKYDAIAELKSPLFNSISVNTANRLERAHFDLLKRQANINLRLESFEFPALFAGIGSSTSREEYKNVRFKEWNKSFGKMRNFVLGYYKDIFGHWPPKARSKKNHFSQSGLNRQALKILYSDLCALYDLLVDRESITPRVIDQAPEDIKEDNFNPVISALRTMLGEFDHSSPPVLPPIPFDIPKIPSMTAIHENYNELPAKKQAKFDKALQPNELLLILIKSRNMDTDALQMPFLNAFKEFELKEAKGVHPADLADQRVGYWLFLYVVIQSLPMLVVDAPDLHWTEGVEYFLCEPPQGNPPWMEDSLGEVRKMWYQTAGQGIVELSADVVMFSVEGIYMRSHCWLAAKEWEQGFIGGAAGDVGDEPPQIIEGGATPLEPPRAVFQDMDPMSNPGHMRSMSGLSSAPGSPQLRPRSRNGSPGGGRRAASHAYRSSIAIGLEPLPLDGMGMPAGPLSRAPSSRPASSAGLQQYPFGARNDSSGNLSQMTNLNLKAESPPPSLKPSHHSSSSSVGGGSTFDDILKGMEQEKKPKKKSFF